jgi:hypothetical protein
MHSVMHPAPWAAGPSISAVVHCKRIAHCIMHCIVQPHLLAAALPAAVHSSRAPKEAQRTRRLARPSGFPGRRRRSPARCACGWPVQWHVRWQLAGAVAGAMHGPGVHRATEPYNICSRCTVHTKSLRAVHMRSRCVGRARTELDGPLGSYVSILPRKSALPVTALAAALAIASSSGKMERPSSTRRGYAWAMGACTAWRNALCIVPCIASCICIHRSAPCLAQRSSQDRCW